MSVSTLPRTKVLQKGASALLFFFYRLLQPKRSTAITLFLALSWGYRKTSDRGLFVVIEALDE